MGWVSINRINYNRLFRDTSAWYHIVFAVDYTNSTQAQRARVYVNGVQETNFTTTTRPGNNTTTFDTYNSSKTHYIGNLWWFSIF